MWHMSRLHSDFETLEIAAQRAGTALACPFASSAEFEAATIQARRAAGIYGPKRHRRQAAIAVTGIALVVLLVSALQ
jgi:hypothetical protein